MLGRKLANNKFPARMQCGSRYAFDARDVTSRGLMRFHAVPHALAVR